MGKSQLLANAVVCNYNKALINTQMCAPLAPGIAGQHPERLRAHIPSKVVYFADSATNISLGQIA